jgi:hypothetical protein
MKMRIIFIENEGFKHGTVSVCRNKNRFPCGFAGSYFLK